MNTNTTKAIIHNDYDTAVIERLTQISLCYSFLRRNIVPLRNVSICTGLPLDFVEISKNELLMKDKIYVKLMTCEITGKHIEHYTTNLKLL